VSYSRLSDGDTDVYVFATTEARLICHWCPFRQGREFMTRSFGKMLRHLKAHQAAGHRTGRAIPGLMAEQPWLRKDRKLFHRYRRFRSGHRRNPVLRRQLLLATKKRLPRVGGVKQRALNNLFHRGVR
jgi:hypothetical protein